jgi:purine catabolism regulator
VKLSELLAAVPEAGLTVLNAGADLDRPVEGLDTSETPDIARYIKPNTLLMTTAMIYHDGRDSMPDLIEKLSRAGAAGLAIKLGRFIKEITPETLEKADRLRFPLLRVPMDTTLGIASHRLQAHILGYEIGQFNAALDIQKKVSQALFKNDTLEELIGQFARLLDQHVLYYDYFFDLTARGSAHGQALTLSGRVTGEIGDLLLQAYKLKPFSGIEEVPLRGSFGEINCMVSPVKAGNQYPFFLAILHENDLVEPFWSLVAEQASIIFSFFSHNQRSMLENEWKSQEELFTHLIGGEGPREQANITRLASWMDTASAFSFLITQTCQAVAVGFTTDALPRAYAGLDHFQLVYCWLRKQLAVRAESCLLLPLASQQRFLLLWPDSVDRLLPQLEAMAEGLWKIVPLDLRFGLGNQARSLQSLRYSCLEARNALDKVMTGGKKRVQMYYSEGAKELFRFVPMEHSRHFCQHVLGDLAFPTGEYERELRRTMEVYLNCLGDIAKTSKLVHAHRNTVKYRLDKIEHLLQQSLSDPEFSLMARLAILLTDQTFFP